MRWLFMFLLACSVLSTHAGEMAYTVRVTDLKAKPYTDAATLSKLPEKSHVEVLARKASWMQIKHDDTTGWVKMLSLRFGDATQQKSGDSGLSALFNVASTGGSGSTVSTGVRGLSEENLKNPKPDPQAMKELQRYTVSKRDAQSFAKSGKLRSNQLDYLSAAK